MVVGGHSFNQNLFRLPALFHSDLIDMVSEASIKKFGSSKKVWILLFLVFGCWYFWMLACIWGDLSSFFSRGQDYKIERIIYLGLHEDTIVSTLDIFYYLFLSFFFYFFIIIINFWITTFVQKEPIFVSTCLKTCT